MTDHEEESSLSSFSHASPDKNVSPASVKNTYSGHGDVKRRWAAVNPRERSIDDRLCDIGPEATVMEYRCGSTRCEDDSLENEKDICAGVRDARDPRVPRPSLRISLLFTENLLEGAVTVRVTIGWDYRR